LKQDSDRIEWQLTQREREKSAQLHLESLLLVLLLTLFMLLKLLE